MPKKRTPTIDTPRAAMDGCRAAVEINHADVPIRAMLDPMVSVLSRMERATQFQEPLRKEIRRKSIDDICTCVRCKCLRFAINNWILETGDWRLTASLLSNIEG